MKKEKKPKVSAAAQIETIAKLLECQQRQIDELTAMVMSKHPDAAMKAGQLNAARSQVAALIEDLPGYPRGE